jgi:hypothetical protein
MKKQSKLYFNFEPKVGDYFVNKTLNRWHYFILNVCPDEETYDVMIFDNNATHIIYENYVATFRSDYFELIR